MTKKAQGLSLNTIIIAVLVLIVLVILVLIFSGKITDFRRGVGACDGRCEESSSGCLEDENPIYLSGCDADGDGRSDGGNFCCKKQAS